MAPPPECCYMCPSDFLPSPFLCFPPQSTNQSTPPPSSRYISHLLGHEGEGSVLSYLKAKGWANELSAGPQVSQSVPCLLGPSEGSFSDTQPG